MKRANRNECEGKTIPSWKSVSNSHLCKRGTRIYSIIVINRRKDRPRKQGNLLLLQQHARLSLSIRGSPRLDVASSVLFASLSSFLPSLHLWSLEDGPSKCLHLRGLSNFRPHRLQAFKSHPPRLPSPSLVARRVVVRIPFPFVLPLLEQKRVFLLHLFWIPCLRCPLSDLDSPSPLLSLLSRRVVELLSLSLSKPITTRRYRANSSSRHRPSSIQAPNPRLHSSKPSRTTSGFPPCRQRSTEGKTREGRLGNGPRGWLREPGPLDELQDEST